MGAVEFSRTVSEQVGAAKMQTLGDVVGEVRKHAAMAYALLKEAHCLETGADQKAVIERADEHAFAVVSFLVTPEMAGAWDMIQAMAAEKRVTA